MATKLLTFNCEKENSENIIENYNGELYLKDEYIYIEIISNNIYPMKKYDNRLKLTDLQSDIHFVKNESLEESYDIIKNFIIAKNICLNDYKNNKFVIYLYSKDKKDLLLFVLHPREISENDFNHLMYKQLININKKLLKQDKIIENIESSIYLIKNNKIDNENKQLILEELNNKKEDNELNKRIEILENNVKEIKDDIKIINNKYKKMFENIKKENISIRDTMNQNLETIKKTYDGNEINKLKEEIFPKLDNLNTEFNILKDNYDTEIFCVICYTKKKNYIFEPCNHNICCEDCAKAMLNKNGNCPKCKKKITKIKKVFS
jgi:hypothetical protein